MLTVIDGLANLTLCIVFLASFSIYMPLFKNVEIVIFVTTLWAILQQIDRFPLLVASFFTFILPSSFQNAIELPILLDFDPVNYLNKICLQYDLSFSGLTIFSVIVLIFFIFEGILYKYGDVNIRRKTVHFLLLTFALMKPDTPTLIGQGMVYIAAVFIRTPITLKYFRFLIKESEKHKDCFSLWIITFAITYAKKTLPYRNFIKLCISICIHDSFASITGRLLKKRNKSLHGLTVGVLSSFLSEILILGTLDIPYHVTMGVIEHCCIGNDNMIVAIMSYCYQLILITNK